ncbi:AIPR family protein [Rhodobacter sp. KR11]|uniref:AIPR family protein n=1 Tax=Rhodobacter sp. KR11 TaxID=2974588 RepID=UPI002222A225|nr:AIPR family protein [Rhodobacter sp. KR11]MCW1918029.1 AIPR family protein [Rhodobacter sp. KR11]
MDIAEFHRSFRATVLAEVNERVNSDEGAFPTEELVFAEMVMEHVNASGICDTPTVCHWTGKVGNANLRITGHALSVDETVLDIFVTHYCGTEEITPLVDTPIVNTAKQAVNFLLNSANGKLGGMVERSSEIFDLVQLIQKRWNDLDQVRIFVVTDGQTKTKQFPRQEVQGRLIGIEAMDIERVFRHSEGKPRDEIAISFEQSIGRALPCVYVPDPTADYDYALTAIPAEVLRALYEKFNAQLLEANIRTFLGAGKKVNKGIAETLVKEPGHFLAYNNGLVIVCDRADFSQTELGLGLSFIKGLQIVNGGQTTSSIYFSSRQNKALDLSHVMVPAKIIILKGEDTDRREDLISKISNFANSQNAVKTSDLSSNKPFHRQLEKLANETWCPDGVGRWFYERAGGAYQVLLLRAGTPAQQKKLKDAIPTKRRLTKNDIARVHEAWAVKPVQVALGNEKNYEQFVLALEEGTSNVPTPLDAKWYRQMIAKVIIFKALQEMISRRDAKHIFTQGMVSVTTYTIAAFAARYEGRVDFEQVWQRQGISAPFRNLLWDWAAKVNQAFVDYGGGRQFSEVAKGASFWPRVNGLTFPTPSEPIPELR